jgi:YidC/Oxa1 family membrane protein insertase
MEKRAVLAIVLSLLVVVVWSILFAPSPPAPPPEPARTEPPGREETQITPQAPEGAAQQESPATPPAGAAPRPPLPQETPVTVDTGVAQFALTSAGASVKAVELHEYRTTLDKGAPPITIAPAPGTMRLPLAADLRLGKRTVPLDKVTFTPSTTALVLSERQPEGEITFRGHAEGGLTVHRTYRFRFKSYVFEMNTQVEGLSASATASMTVLWGPGLLQHGAENGKRQGETETEARSYVRGKVFHEAPKGVGETMSEEGKVGWTALADTYFAAVLIPGDPGAESAAVMVRRVQEKALEVGLRTPLTPNGGKAVQAMRVYVGPKKQQLLTAADASLDKLIDLGFFSPLARPMVQLLQAINSVVHNYGVTIIFVTILIKIVFWPLTQKSYKSMQAMQKLQPKLKELQVLYKDDRQGLNRAMMQLYREHKVNPMGGCLPMLIQIPFFFAFYNALLYSIELRHAPFICWEQKLFWVGRGICDLSVSDPSYVTPVLMGVTMFIQQKMTPTVGDPTQAKVMQFMPLIFLFFFLNAPAGLVIYWLMNNVLSIAQQLAVNRSRQQEAVQVEAASKG